MRRVALLYLLAIALFADSQPGGLRPRGKPSDYAAQATQDGMTLGAVVLSAGEVRHAFATDLNRGYLVVEVGVYPGTASAELHATDFSLRVGANQATIRPVTAEAVAAALTRPSKSQTRRASSDLDIYPSATIGYERGRVYDPTTGQTRGGGWYGGTGVAVASGGPAGPPPGPSTSERNRPVMRGELEDKALPEGVGTQPVAGYLYFPLPAAKRSKSVAYELVYDAPSSRVTIPLPPPADK